MKNTKCQYQLRDDLKKESSLERALSLQKQDIVEAIAESVEIPDLYYLIRNLEANEVVLVVLKGFTNNPLINMVLKR